MKTIQYDSSKMKIVDRILVEYYADDTHISIPKGVIGISEDAFSAVNVQIKKISLPKSLLWIGPRAFKGCSGIETIVLPENLTEISDEAFYDCISLTEITVPRNVYRIGKRAFSGCGFLRTIECTEGLVRIEDRAFYNCSLLENISLPRSCAFIAENAFELCDNVVISAPSGSEAEWFANEENISFEKIISKTTFTELKEAYDSQSDDFVIRNGVLVEYNGADPVINIPNDVIIIGSEVFMQNLQLVSITIPREIEIIGTGAFKGCSELSEVNLNGDYVYISEYAFSECSALNKVILFCGGTQIRSFAFLRCKQIKQIVLPDFNVTIYKNAFANCDGIEEIKLPVGEWNISPDSFPLFRNKVTWFLSCQNTDYKKLPITSPAQICPYAFKMEEYITLCRFFKEKGINVVLEQDTVSDITPYLFEHIINNEGAETLDAEVHEPAVMENTDSVSEEVIHKDYKKDVQINGLQELVECDIILDDEVISNEQVIRHFMKYVIETIRSKDHVVGLAVHTGSDCFNAVLLLISAIEALLRNTSTSEDVVESLEPGDYVLFVPKAGVSPSKYILEKKDEDGTLHLIKNNKTKSKQILPKSSWHKISPYNGTTETTNDAGLRKTSSKRTLFYKSVLNIDAKEIPKAPNASIVVMLPRNEAMRFWNRIKVKHNDVVYCLSDFVTAAFYTENGISYYAGNPGKNDPVIKFTDDPFKARELINAREGNKIVGTLILSPDYIERSPSEIMDVISDKRLEFVYTSSSVSRFASEQLINENQEIAAFACYPEYINKYLDPIYPERELHRGLVHDLRTQIQTIRKCCCIEEIVGGGISEQDYYDLREEILSFKDADYDLEEKDLFVIESLAALKILMSALFPVDIISQVLKKPNFETRLEQIRAAASVFPEKEKKKAASIIDTLILLYYEIGNMPGKQERFQELLQKYSYGTIALIVPKAYYAQVLYEYDSLSRLLIETNRLIVTTATRFNPNLHYSAVIFISNTFGKGFAPQRCYSAENIVGLFYQCEKNLYSFSAKRTKGLQTKLLNMNFFPDDNSNIMTDEGNEEHIITDEELDDYINHVSNDYLLRPLNQQSWGQANNETEIAAIVFFESGERAFLSKYYKPYVFDEEKGEISSPDVSKLTVGDVMIFNTDYYGTRDIVDSILQSEIKNLGAGDTLKIMYRYSQHWKQVLRDYSKETGKTAREIARALKSQGISVEVPTIMGWMDEDSHTVGPRDPAVFQQIGFLVNDRDLFNNPDRYLKACGAIRSKRGDILKTIAKAMLSMIDGSQATNFVSDDVQDLIAKLAKTYRIEAIQPVKRVVPTGVANHPIDEIDM